MSFRLKMWQATIGRFIGWVDTAMDQKLLRESIVKPFVRAYGRDTFRYYESGRSVDLDAEMMTGSTGLTE